MSATNHTTNYELPIFVGTDKPAWLVDWNSAMTAIDTAIHTAEGKADQAGTDIGGIESSISTINSTLTSINNAVSQLRVDTNANTGSINTITSLIGNGEPTTTDKTIIGAINELNEKESELDSLTLASDNTNVTSTIGTVSSHNIKTLKSTNNRYIKLFGVINMSEVNSGGTDPIFAVISNTNLTIPEQFIVSGYAVLRYSASGSDWPVPVSLKFKTNGNVEIFATGTFGSATYAIETIVLPPCLIVNSSIE